MDKDYTIEKDQVYVIKDKGNPIAIVYRNGDGRAGIVLSCEKKSMDELGDFFDILLNNKPAV